MAHLGSEATVPMPACVVCGAAGAVEIEPPR
jgi:hypothetical protein